MAEYTPRLKQRYEDEIRGNLRKEYSYSNDMMIPKLEKIVLNMGVGEAVGDSKKINSAKDDMKKVTLRRNRMYEFLDRLITIAMPRIRDFRGVSPKSFDGRGNYALGIKEHIVFPEIDFDKVDVIWGLDIVICTSASSNDEAKSLLRQLNMPFVN